MPDIAELLPVHDSHIVGEVRVDPAVLLDQSDAPQIEIGHGFNSRAYQVGEYVIKVGKQAKSHDSAVDLAGTMDDEYKLLSNFLGDNVPPTTLWVAGEPGSGDSRVVTLQPFIPGITLREHVDNPETSNLAVLAFLQRALNMYQDTSFIADLANIEGAFNLLRTGNLVIKEDGRASLVDTNFGKVQRSRSLGPLFSSLIALGVGRGFNRIQKRPQTWE